MQFDYFFKAGMPVAQVEFKNKLSAKVWYVLFEVFERLGGKQVGDDIDCWEFPTHITAKVLHTVIHNTCFVCGSPMQDEAIALKNEDVFVKTTFRGEDALIPYPQSGAAKLKQVRKCQACGHSHT